MANFHTHVQGMERYRHTGCGYTKSNNRSTPKFSTSLSLSLVYFPLLPALVSWTPKVALSPSLSLREQTRGGLVEERWSR